MGEIINDLMESLRAHLQQKMVDAMPAECANLLSFVDADGVDRVLAPSVIRVGRIFDPTEFQDDPNMPLVNISIHPYDTNDAGTEWAHTLAGMAESGIQNAGYTFTSPYEIGGSTLWWRRLTVKFYANFVDSNQDQAEALRLTNVVRVLLERLCTSPGPNNPHGWPCGGLTDDLGEVAIRSETIKAHCWEGGGPPEDFIWRGQVWVQVLTAKN